MATIVTSGKRGAITALTKTNANLASSATAGWVSNAIVNTVNALDVLIFAEFAAVNTAPASSKAIFFFAGGYDGVEYTSTGDGVPTGAEAAITFPSISTQSIVMPSIGVLPYPVQNRKLNGLYRLSSAFGYGNIPNS